MAADRTGVEVQLEEHARRLNTHEKEHHLLWGAIEKLRNRLPVWATFVISLLFTAIGVLVTLLVK